MPIPTSVSAEVLGRAKGLAAGESGAAAGGGDEESAPPRAMRPGVVYEGRLNIASGDFFSLEVPPSGNQILARCNSVSQNAYFKVNSEMAATGVVLAARSRRRNDRFRIIVFDGRGDVRHPAAVRTPPISRSSSP